MDRQQPTASPAVALSPQRKRRARLAHLYRQQRRFLIYPLGILFYLLAGYHGQAQSGAYWLTWVSFQSGGQSSNGGYTLVQVVGAPVAGTQQGGGYTLVSNIANPATTATATATPLPRVTPTATNIPTDTSTPTNTPTATPSPTASQSGDVYEVDDTCPQAHLQPVNGVSQEHSFHRAGDEDWIAFDALEGVEYRIEVQIPAGSPANVVLDTYLACTGNTLGPTWDNPNTPGARLTIKAPITGRLYIQAMNHDAQVSGAQVRYQIAVQQKGAAPAVGALIIVAGRYRWNDELQPRIDNVANNVYSLFEHYSYTRDDIYYLTTANRNNPQDPHQSQYDGAATLQDLEQSITEWAKTRVDAHRALTLYLVDHGYRELFYLDQPNGQQLTPTQLHRWLTQLETDVPGVKINIIIEACKSGSFTRTLSKTNRIVITSTNADKDAVTSDSGAHFSDQLIAALRQGSNLYTSFQIARETARLFLSEQDAWLDANGDGQPNGEEDRMVAAQLGFGQFGTLADEMNLWPPYIQRVQLTEAPTDTQTTILAEITDNSVITGVWAVILPPSYNAPVDGSELRRDHAQPMHAVTTTPGVYELQTAAFTESGEYRIVVYAVDDDGLTSTPYLLTTRRGGRLYLPIVVR